MDQRPRTSDTPKGPCLLLTYTPMKMATILHWLQYFEAQRENFAGDGNITLSPF